MGEWARRLQYALGRRRFEAELDDEIRFHLETRAAELVASGLAERDAYFQARREFGGIARMQEGSRGAWRAQWVVDFATDVRLALRSFRRSPGFAITAIVSLGLGIGATSAIFSMMDAALWRPLAIREPERVVRLAVDRKVRGADDMVPAAFVPQMERMPAFEGVLASNGDGLSFEYDGRAERIVAEVVSPNYFEVLGVRPQAGRYFGAQWAPEAVLSYRFWQRRFAGDPSVIGKTIRLNTRPFTIVGVSAPSFYGLTRGRDYELRIPRLPPGRELPELSILGGPEDGWVNVMARLRPGVTREQASAMVDAQMREFARTTPIKRFQRAEMQRARLEPGGRGWIEDDLAGFRAPFYTLLALVGVALLIACANLAGMLLARATARAREMAVRCSIGAGRGRLARQMLAESMTLAMLGGLAALAVAGPAGRVLFTFLPQGHVNTVIDIHTEGRVLLFTFAVAATTGLLFGLVPAWQATRGNLAAALKSQNGSGSSARLRGALVVGQVAFSVALLACAGAFVRSLAALRPAEYRAANRILLLTIKPQQELYPQARLKPLLAELTRRMSSIPGVEGAAFAEAGPLGSRTGTDPIVMPDGSTRRVTSDIVTPGFFRAMGIPLVAGRDFGPLDRAGAPMSVVINQSLARELFGGENPVGRTARIPIGKMDGDYQVIGVAADTHYRDVHGRAGAGLWLAAEQQGLYMPTLFVRSARADTGTVMAEIRRRFDEVDRGFPIFNVRTMEDRVEDAMSQERMVAEYAAALGGLALAMAGIGLYGLLAYAVARRTREIGIRIALGSGGVGVVWLVGREALGLVAAGAVAGVVAAVGMGRVLTTAPDAVVLGAAAAVMAAVAVVATIVPAARAARVDPLKALRVE